jgi:O-antigen/teichoic acid export membrane protein
MDKYKNLVINLILFTLNTVATKLITFLLVPLYTYYLSLSEFGITDMSTAVIALITPLATLSLSSATLRYTIEDPVHQDSYFSLGFWMTTFSCLVVTALTPILDLSVFGGLGNYKLLFIFSYVVNAFQLFFSDASRALDQVKVIPIASVISGISTGGLAFLFISVMKLGIEGYFYSLIIGGMLGVIAFMYFGHLLAHLIQIPRSTIFAKLRPMLIYSLPMIPNALFWWIGISINRFFITGMLGIAASGIFAAANKIPTILNLACGIFQQAWTLSSFQEFRHSNISGYFTTILRIFHAGIIEIASAVLVLSPWLASLLLQKDFLSSASLIPMLILAIYFNTLNAFYGTVYTASMKTKMLFITTVAGAVTTIIGTWSFVSFWGLFGAALAMTISNAVVLILRLVHSQQIIKINIHWKSVLPSFILLTAQVIIGTMHSGHYQNLSIGIFISITIIQFCCLAPFGTKILTRIRHRPN